MREKLQDVAELLKMLEMVFSQGEQLPERRFPWAGVRLTLKQAQDFLHEQMAQSRYEASRPAERGEERPEEPRQRQDRPGKRPEARPPFPPSTSSRPSSSHSVEPPIRGTFNRVQLTEEPLEETTVAKSL